MDESTALPESTAPSAPSHRPSRLRRLAAPLALSVVAAAVGAVSAVAVTDARSEDTIGRMPAGQHAAMGDRMAQPAQMRGPRPGPSADHLAALAASLEVSVDDLEAARDAVRAALPHEGMTDRDTHRAAALELMASELGIDVGTLTAAVEQHRVERSASPRMRGGMDVRDGMGAHHGPGA